ncbi:hypothetical protein [Chitinophaga sp.]|uniref:hypothetical protein n=1 Tax=Chitinophaga sp. TaxID=1869181 RepID=UPI0031D4C7E5
MKRIALIAFILGVVLATLAYFAEIYDWVGLQEYLTVGFTGYVLIISAAAYYMSSVLVEWSAESTSWEA